MSTDILEQMSKQELLFWIRGKVRQRPTQSDVLYARWECLEVRIDRLFAADRAAFKKADPALIDELDKQFAASIDATEREKLFLQIRQLRNQMKEYYEISRNISRQRAQVEKRSKSLFQQYEAALASESRRCCEHAGCDKPAETGGLCQRHYAWWQEQQA